MLFLLFLIVILYKFHNNKIFTSKVILGYFLGLVIIVINIFWTKSISGSYFAGSDASSYYYKAMLFSNEIDLIKYLDIRYVGYNIYQILVTYPYINNEFLASVFIKLSNWTLFYLSFLAIIKSFNISLEINIVKYNFYYYSLIILGLWLSLYNFRDIIIVSILLSITAVYFSNKKYKVVKVLLLLSLLFYFRFFYVGILFISYFTSKYIFNYLSSKKQSKIKIFGKIILLISLLFFSFYLISSVSVIMSLLKRTQDITHYNSNYLLIKNNNPIYVVTASFFAGNSINFFVEYFINSYRRAFTITPISAVFIILIYFYSYIYFFLFLITLVTPFNLKKTISVTRDKESKLQIFIYTVILFVFVSIFSYSLFMGGVQERIRIPFLMLTILYLLIFKKYSKKSFLFVNIFVIAVFLSFFGYLIRMI